MEEEARVCKKCGAEKPINEFRKHKLCNGYRHICKECNYKKKREQYKELYNANPEKYKEKSRQKSKEYHKRHKDTINKKRVELRKNNPEKKKFYYELSKKWRENNPEKARILGRRSAKKKSESLRGNLYNRMCSALNRALKYHGGSKRKRHWEDLVGYTTEELMKHLENKFTEGMSWEKFSKGKIHIDHIIPDSVFNYNDSNQIDFGRCWALDNLQPMWSLENISKGNKLAQPFQPSLAL